MSAERISVGLISAPKRKARQDADKAPALDLDHVARLRAVVDDLPPIQVRKHPTTAGRYELIDGQHRLSAHRFEGREVISAEIVDLDDPEAFRESVRANVTHGRPLRTAERKAAAAYLVAEFPHASDRLIAEWCGLSDKTIATLRPTAENPQLDTQAPPATTGVERPAPHAGPPSAPPAAARRREGADGRSRPADPAAQAAAIAEAHQQDPSASDRELARKTGSSPTTVKKHRHLTAAPPPPDEPEGASVRDVVLVFPKKGYRNEGAFQHSNACREAGKFLDRYVVQEHQGDPDLFTEHARRVPPAWAPQVASDARRMAAAWLRMAEAVEITNRPEVAK